MKGHFVLVASLVKARSGLGATIEKGKGRQNFDVGLDAWMATFQVVSVMKKVPTVSAMKRLARTQVPNSPPRPRQAPPSPPQIERQEGQRNPKVRRYSEGEAVRPPKVDSLETPS